MFSTKQWTLPTENKTIPHQRAIKFISHKRQENHMVIVANFPDKEAAEVFKREMKKVIRRENHLLKKGLSFEMYLNF